MEGRKPPVYGRNYQRHGGNMNAARGKVTGKKVRPGQVWKREGDPTFLYILHVFVSEDEAKEHIRVSPEMAGLFPLVRASSCHLRDGKAHISPEAMMSTVRIAWLKQYCERVAKGGVVPLERGDRDTRPLNYQSSRPVPAALLGF